MARKDKSRLIRAFCTALCVPLVSAGLGYTPAALQGGTEMPTVTIKLGGSYPESDRTVTAAVSNVSLNRVKSEIFGANVSWRADGGGLWDTAKDSPNAEMLLKLKQSGVNVLRYPGGIEGDYFHWYETVGDKAARVDQIDCFSSEYPVYADRDGLRYPVTFGVDELFRLCDAAGVKADIQLNSGNGTPSEAADYMRYLNEKGYSDRVSSICIGNEACMAEERVAGLQVTKTPEQYINFCNGVFSESGAARLGVIGLPSGHPLSVYADWDRKILSALSDKIDFIDVHVGYSYYYESLDSTAESVKCFLGSSKWISELIKQEKDTLLDYAGADAAKIGIHISELGPVGGAYPNSLAGAVFLADLYNTVLAEPKITATDYLPLVSHYDSAQLIGSMNYDEISTSDYYWDNASTYVFRMYSALTGSEVLKTSVSGAGSFDTAACGLVPAIKDVADGTVNTYFNPETGAGSIFVINKSLEKSQSFTVTLPFAASVTGVTELWNENPVASNRYNYQRKIQLNTDIAIDGTETDSVSVSTKPVSLVRIDFTSDGKEPEKPNDTVVSDSFSSDSTVSYRQFGDWSVSGGTLINTLTAGSGYLYIPCELNDSTVEFDVLSCTAGMQYGAVFRADNPCGEIDGGDGYCVMYDGAWAFAGALNGTFSQIKTTDTAYAYSPSENGTVPAHWKISCVEGTMKVWLNGGENQVMSVHDSRYTSGFTGIRTFFAGSGTARLILDNLTVNGARMGDANEDNAVDIRDIVRLKRYFAGVTADISLKNARLTTDSAVGSQDAVRLRRYLLGTLPRLTVR